jgi:Fe2+ or Zn2+ uptake regulation protein
MNTNLKQLQIILEKKDIKPTYIRLKILNYLENKKTHFRAEKIFKAIKKEIPTISLTTVYNTLDIFRKKGLIRPLFITGKEVHYDRDTSSHFHFFCEKCGRIINLDTEYDGFEKENIGGNKIKEVYGYFKGVCKDCKNKKMNIKGEKNENV